MKERTTGKTKTFHVESAEYHVLGQKVIDNVKMGSTVITDGFSSYETLSKFYEHKTVNHSAGEYVRAERNEARQAINPNFA